MPEATNEGDVPIVSGRDIRAPSGPSRIHVQEVYEVVLAWTRATGLGKPRTAPSCRNMVSSHTGGP